MTEQHLVFTGYSGNSFLIHPLLTIFGNLPLTVQYLCYLWMPCHAIGPQVLP